MIRRNLFAIAAVITLPGLFGLFLQASEGQESQIVPTAEESSDPMTSISKSVRLREGTEIVEQRGRFIVSGDRALFITADDHRRFTVLENLNLERIAKAVTEHPDRLHWNISGMVTEYRGENYLLIKRATVRTRSDSSL